MTKRIPRDVRGAQRRGWHVIELDAEKRMDVSYLSLLFWTDRHAKGRVVSSYSPTKFAFEKEEDASWFVLKWR